jgi:hypothetical protein
MAAIKVTAATISMVAGSHPPSRETPCAYWWKSGAGSCGNGAGGAGDGDGVGVGGTSPL